MAAALPSVEESLPKHKDLFYNGEWHAPKNGKYRDTYNPGNGEVIEVVAPGSTIPLSARKVEERGAYMHILEQRNLEAP